LSESSPAQPTVAVIGGGYAGIYLAKALDDVTHVVLIEPKDAFVHNVAALRALADPSWLPRIFMPYGGLLARGEVVRDRAVKVEPGRVTLASGNQVDADYIVLATGSQYPFPAKSDVDGTADAHDKFRAAHAAVDAAGRVLLVGAGAVGIELAAEIKAVWPDKEVTLLDAAAELLGARFRDDLKDELHRQLTDIGVRVALASPLRSLPPTEPGVLGEFTVQTEAGAALTADVWFRCFGVSPVSDYLAGELAGARQPDGFVAVTPYLQVQGQDRVFALGDVAAADAKMVGLTRGQADIVAANIKAMIAGDAPAEEYQPGAASILVPVRATGGSGQLPGTDNLLAPEAVASIKGEGMYVDRYAELLGVAAPAGGDAATARR
jgi:NADH dehydrogenase FAD-containing subunit